MFLLIESEKKSKVFFVVCFVFISVTPKTALYPKAGINFILKRKSEFCHSGHLWLCLQEHTHSGNCSSTTALRFPSKICPQPHPPGSRSSIWVFIYWFVCLFIVIFALELRKLICFFPVVQLIRNIAQEFSADLFSTKAHTKMSIHLRSWHSLSSSGLKDFRTLATF